MIPANDNATSVTLTVVDHTEEILSVMFKGTMTQWGNVQGYDDGTNGDPVAGDHEWSAVVEASPGSTHEWGAISTQNEDGSTCTACDGTDGWGTWLLGAYSNKVFTVEDDGSVVGKAYVP